MFVSSEFIMAFAPEIAPEVYQIHGWYIIARFSMIRLWRIMEIVGSTNISNNFRDSGNYGSGSRSPISRKLQW